MPSVPVRYRKTTGINYNNSASETIDKIALHLPQDADPDGRLITVPCSEAVIEFVGLSVNDSARRLEGLLDEQINVFTNAIGQLVATITEQQAQIEELQNVIYNLQNQPT